MSTTIKSNIMKSQEVITALKKAGIPTFVITALQEQNHLINIVNKDDVESLTNIKGVAEKRAAIIINILKAALTAAKKNVEVRESWKVSQREKATGFSVRSFESCELFRDHLDVIHELAEYRPSEDEDPSILPELRQKLYKLMDDLTVNSAFTARLSEARSIRLNEADVPNVLGVDYESKRPTRAIIAVAHEAQQVLNFSWKLFASTKKDGEKLLDKFQQDVMYRLMAYGLKVLLDNGKEILYGGVGSSAGHQKKEVLVMAEARLMKEHERFFWFGHTMQDFIQNTKLTGAEFWKMRANLLRPHLKPFATKEGRILKVKNVLVVKDVEKIFQIPNARIIGMSNGSLVNDGAADAESVLGDGAVLFIREMETQGQLTAPGLKGFGLDASSSMREMCEKHGLDLETVMNMTIEGIDGKMHRVGDYDAICGEGCWKFDKAFASYAEYLTWLDSMSARYPGIDNLSILRQSEEIEDEKKVRRLTRTLIQQWMYMSGKEIRQLTNKARSNLREGKTFAGAIKKLAALRKPEEERTDLNKLFAEAPWLATSPDVLDYLKERWERSQVEAASGKFRTEGQYPYIMQDPVALLEVWLLGMDPNDLTLGVLHGDEVSCADVPDGKELLCVRFPANFLTARVMTNRACKKAFASINGVMAISVHSTILIEQDGDVDGDEMCVIYDKLAIELTKRMRNEFNPPIVLFKHGSKAERHTHETKAAFLRDASDALWRAKKYDSVGLYANLATKCAYLAAVAHQNGKIKTRDNYLVWMSAASTGAIMAIDQVKGNQVDEALIEWLDQISSKVRTIMVELAKNMGVDPKAAKAVRHPFVHYYNAMNKRKPVPVNECLPANPANFVDEIASLILRDTGKWENFDTQGVTWNAAVANEALTNHTVPLAAVKKGIVSKELYDLVKDNWFKAKAKTRYEQESDKTAETLAKMTVGSEIGIKELLLLLWRNEASATYRMEGATLYEKKAEYITVCRDILNLFINSSEWINVYSKERPSGYVYTAEEKQALLSNYVIRDGLELLKGNGLTQSKGNYAMFCLKLFAKEARENLAVNGCNAEQFGSAGIADAVASVELETLEDDLELFQVVPAVDLPEYTKAELLALAETYGTEEE